MTPDTTFNTPDPPNEILHPGSRALFRFWETVRGERSAPTRKDVDLKTISEYVPSIFILERHAESQSYRWRLAGTKICQIWHKNLTGNDFFVGWGHFERQSAIRLLDGVTDSQQPCALRFKLFTSLGHTIGAELLGLPVVSQDGKSTQVFGAILAFRDIENLGYDRITRVELHGARVIWTEPIPGRDVSPAPFSGAHGKPFSTFQVIDGGLSGR